MVNITHKSSSLRQAVATAVLRVSKQETIRAIENRQVPKGDVFEFSRAAGLLAVKKTSDVIPDCHPLPVEYAAITHAIDGFDVVITVEVHTVYKTGAEVEAMHGAAITALTMYDMLKPLDKDIEISSIRLESKKGGKSDMQAAIPEHLSCAVVVCSDSVAAGKKADAATDAIGARLAKHGVAIARSEVVPDDFDTIQQKARQYGAEGVDLLLFTGGTGLSPRDVTPDAVRPLLDREIPGIMEAARQYGRERTPYAMLSRGIAGFIGKMLVITLPGSPKGAVETIDAIFPHLLHVFKVLEGARHD